MLTPEAGEKGCIIKLICNCARTCRQALSVSVIESVTISHYMQGYIYEIRIVNVLQFSDLTQSIGLIRSYNGSGSPRELYIRIFTTIGVVPSGDSIELLIRFNVPYSGNDGNCLSKLGYGSLRGRCICCSSYVLAGVKKDT